MAKIPKTFDSTLLKDYTNKWKSSLFKGILVVGVRSIEILEVFNGVPVFRVGRILK